MSIDFGTGKGLPMQYRTDQSSGFFTDVFTLEPRRYGAGVKF